MKTIIFLYILLTNLFTFSLMVFDKYQAQSQSIRVPEKWLFFFSFIGGSIGAFIAMRLVRHKTRHWTFVYGIPFFLFLNFLFLYPLTMYEPSEWYKLLLNVF